MKFALSRFLISFDIFGHRPELTYKGLESYGTAAGGIASLVVKVSTLISFFFYVDKMINMKDPNVTSYELDLTEEEREKTGAVNFADKNFFLSIYPLINEKYVKDVPPEVGFFYADVDIGEIWKDGEWVSETEHLEIKDCHEVIPKERQEWGEEGAYSKCVDPKEWTITAALDGTSVGERQVVYIGFALC